MPFTQSQVKDIMELIEKSIKQTVFNDGFITNIVDRILEKIDIGEINEGINRHERRIEELVKNNEILQKKVDKMEQLAKKNNFRIFGIPETRNENTEDKVQQLIQNQLKLNIPKESFVFCKRIGKYSENQIRTVLLTIDNENNHGNIIRSRKLLKGTNIAIAEDLTATRYKLFREVCEIHGKRQTWVKNGNVFLKYNNKVMMIRSTSEIPKLSISGEMDDKNLAYALKPISILTTLTGQTVHKLRDNGTFEFSKIRLFQIACYLLVICAFNFLSYNQVMFTEVSKELNPPHVNIQTFFSCNYMADNLLYLIILITQVVCNKRIKEISEKFIDLDHELGKQGFRSDISAANENVRRTMLQLIFICIIPFTVIINFCVCLSILKFNIIFATAVLVPMIIIQCDQAFFFGWLHCSIERFMIINTVFQREITLSRSIKVYPKNCYIFSEKMELFVHLHKILTKISKSVNVVYAFNTLATITVTFIMLVWKLYGVMCILTREVFTDYVILIIILCHLTLCNAYWLYLLVKYSSSLSEEANSSRQLLTGIKVHPDKVGARNAVVALTLKLMQNKLHITACKLFNIDGTLLFSTISAVFSYLFITVQFRDPPAVLLPTDDNVTVDYSLLSTLSTPRSE